MGDIFSYLRQVPEYLQHVWKTMPVVFILVVIVFIISLFSGKIPGIIRKIFIVAVVVYAIIGGFTRRTEYGRQMVWVAVLILLLLGLFRGIIYLVQTSRQNKINAKIEEKALEKAARRRGSFRSKQGLSDSTSSEEDYVPDKMNSEEINAIIQGADPEDVIRIDKENEAASVESLLNDPPASPANAPYTATSIEANVSNGETPSDQRANDSLPEHLSADELYTMMNRLSDLHSLGILTDEEFARKKAELLQRV